MDDVDSTGWVFHLRDLLERGLTKARVYRQVRLGALIRLRVGWFARPDVPQSIARAVKIGGRLACVSAADHHGLDVPDSVTLHVAVPANAPRVRAMVRGAALVDEVGAVMVHWCEAVSMRVLHRPQGVVEAILLAASCLPDDWFVALIDSGISRRGHRDPIVGPSLMHELRESLDSHHRDLLAFCDSLSESCIESLVRFRLRLLGICVRSQVAVIEGFRVDFVLDRNIVIEVDGSTFHSGPAAFEADRVRDATLNALGYRVLRFSYRQVVDDWPSVLATILEVRDQERAARRRQS